MICPLCDSRDSRVLTKRTKRWVRDYYKCDCCGLVYLDEFSQLLACEEQERYLHHDNSLSNAGYVAWLSSIVEEALPYINIGGSLLDYGCGHTPVLKDVLEHSYSATVDIYDLYFFNRLLEPECYDTIFVTEVVEHFGRVKLEFERVLSYLASGGKVVIVTGFAPEEDEEFLDWWYISDVTHRAFFSRRTFMWIAKRYSLAIEYCNGKNMIVMGVL